MDKTEMKDIVIPRPLQIVIDDLGWFCGDDDREFGGASRTGMMRRHGYKDYKAINDLGQALGQKILCAFCLDEWDIDNRMKDMPTVSKYGKEWDNARFIDVEEAKKCVEVINDSPYIDFGLHGMGHGYYSEDNISKDRSDYYIITKDKKLVMNDDEYIRKIIKRFFEMMELHGIKKEVTGFVPPSGAYRYKELSRLLAEFGIKYVSTPMRFMKCEDCEKPTDIAFENGIITTERERDLFEWNSHSNDFSDAEIKIDTFGAHWPNFLHFDPDRNGEVVKSAIKYFYRCAEDQRTVIAEDMRFTSTQTAYWKYAEVSENENGETVIDLSKVPKHENYNNYFCINSRFPITCEGGKLTEYAGRKGFITYKIEPESDVIILK